MKNDLERLRSLVKAIEHDPLQQRFALTAIENYDHKAFNDKEKERDWMIARFNVYAALS